ncbi:hypothetical protein COU58_00530 [Candidatus Pacearchaeota archaeon CG10_big_fil_rev_8_21_14_0_10_32_42]|nr:MAG: hypothetical protein COU58_00530 [Candidatus Pacearchaeota archaeon CG10_big_fil_rev_8_21_14_0_10_32_42]
MGFGIPFLAKYNCRKECEKEMDSIHCAYKETNESLESILKGMDVNSSDSILGIMGSGHQGLAMVSKGCKVNLFDYEKDQIEYFYKIINFLKNEKNSDQSCSDFLIRKLNKKSPKEFFSSIQNIKEIRKNANRLSFFGPIDLFNLNIDFENYNKVYLLNVLGYRNENGSFSRFKSFGDKFLSGTLFYITRSPSLEIFDEVVNRNVNYFLDIRLTKLAKSFESGWEPFVIIKK